MRKRQLFPIVGTTIIILGTIVAIRFAKGYRPNFTAGNLQGTGLLVTNSVPKGAQAFIDGKLTTATDDTLNLAPGTYQIQIKKDGFTSWEKTLIIKQELVTQTNATLFSSVPTLKPLTFTGASQPTPSPDGQKIVYIVKQAANPSENGLWIIELSGPTLILAKQPRQIAREQTLGTDTSITWSPDASELLISSQEANFLLDPNRFNDHANLKDVTAQLPLTFSQWEQQLARKELERLLTLPDEMQKIATTSATNLYFSPDEEKLLYTATQSVTIPENLIPPLPSESTQPEERSLEPNATYVYDLKEDKNFRVLDPSPAELAETLIQKTRLVDQIIALPLFATESSPSSHLKLQQGNQISDTIASFNSQYTPLSIQNIHWFPTSNHVIIIQPQKITIIEYDGTNPAVIFANSFAENFAYPWPNASRLIILTNLNQDSNLPSNLYSINLK